MPRPHLARAREYDAPFVFCVDGIEEMGENRELRCAVPENQFFERIYALVSPNIRTWQAIGAVIALVGSIVAAGLGTVSSVLGWFLAGPRFGPLLDQVGTILFFLTIPLLIIAAHCLDLLERKSKSSPIPVAGDVEQVEASELFDPSSYLPGSDLPVAALPARRPPDFTD